MSISTVAIRIFLASSILFFAHCQALAEHSYTFTLSGSGSGLASIRPLVNEFHRQNPSIYIQLLPSLGTTGGILALSDGAIDLSIAARPLSSEEQKLDLVYQPYACTVIAFTTHTETASSNFTEEEIIQILSGEKTHWPDGSYIRLVMRSVRESDFIPIINHNQALANALSIGTSRNDVIFASTAADNLETLQSLPGSLGLMSIAQLESEQPDLKPLAYNDIAPTIANLRDNRYPFRKTFALVHKKQPLAAPMKRFVDFLHSDQACAILEANGQLCR